ncbi:signal peptidase I [Shewanella sp.]|uniref:signal peptidase I n=1 Tax=Shewanella sp. TaxID=50422 RepID=UPI0040546778
MTAYFSIVLAALTLFSGGIWLTDIVLFKPKRKMTLKLAESTKKLSDEAKEAIIREPYIVDTAHSIFPVIAVVLVLRSFLYEPFQIPSPSMMPTLLNGDFILVEKYAYGLKDPIWRTQLIETGKPLYGDAIVFKYPADPKIDYIKRVIGLPGDTVIYRNKQLYIQKACPKNISNSSECPKFELIRHTELNKGEFSEQGMPMLHYEENIFGIKHDILINPRRPDMTQSYYRQQGTNISEFVVPDGNYFVMGDNRDHSSDSRFWGFVPEDNLVGKAVMIWISFEFNRDEKDFLPTWIPTDIRLNRAGKIN